VLWLACIVSGTIASINRSSEEWDVRKSEKLEKLENFMSAKVQ
jgi:hypothetical protein